VFLWSGGYTFRKGDDRRSNFCSDGCPPPNRAISVAGILAMARSGLARARVRPRIDNLRDIVRFCALPAQEAACCPLVPPWCPCRAPLPPAACCPPAAAISNDKGARRLSGRLFHQPTEWSMMSFPPVER
jgi:hypothetical protein